MRKVKRILARRRIGKLYRIVSTLLPEIIENANGNLCLAYERLMILLFSSVQSGNFLSAFIYARTLSALEMLAAEKNNKEREEKDVFQPKLGYPLDWALLLVIARQGGQDRAMVLREISLAKKRAMKDGYTKRLFQLGILEKDILGE